MMVNSSFTAGSCTAKQMREMLFMRRPVQRKFAAEAAHGSRGIEIVSLFFSVVHNNHFIRLKRFFHKFLNAFLQILLMSFNHI